LLEAASLKSAEAALTGESEPASKRVVTLNQDDALLGNRRNI
jgi:magnesium-transporting ATPase (P-type)